MADLYRDARAKEEVWDAIEDTFRQSILMGRDKEDREASEKHRDSIDRETDALMGLIAERKQILDKLSRIDDLIKAAKNRITWDENSYKMAREAVRDQRQKEDAEAAEMMRTGRFVAHQQQRGGFPVKNGLPPAPQFGPQYYYPQQQAQPQPHRQPPPDSQAYAQAPAIYTHQRPRDGMAPQRQADRAPAAPNSSQSVQRKGEGVDPSSANTTQDIDNRAPVSSRDPVDGKAAGTEKPAEMARAGDKAPNGTSGGNERQSFPQPTKAANGITAGNTQTADAPEKTGVEVYDAEGNLIGEVKRIEERNAWIKAALQLPIKRRVVIRAGRLFGPEDLGKIYDPADGKRAKWLSCMIQAAGEVQAQECSTCAKYNSVFSQCVIIEGDERFPRCGNCEWNRQGCIGASLTVPSKSPAGTRPKSLERPQTGPTPEPLPPRRSLSRRASLSAEQPQPSGGFTAVNSSATAAKKPSGPTPAVQQSVEDESHNNSEADGQPRKEKERKSLPGGRASQQGGAAGDDVPHPQKKTKGRKSLPDGQAQKEGGEDDEAEAEEEEDTEEITKDMLVFKDDGTVFTQPEIMRGVPVAKISSSHPYWEPNWTPLEDLITPTLLKWQEKYEKALVEASSQSSKYLANRQVNRGNAVLKYVREGPIHPLQIIAKQWVTKKLFNYDTLHRLVQILDEFTKFKVDVSPEQWVRHRLHQKFLEKGEKFALDEEVDALYHDPKVRYIRKKSGFGNIGRPSGYRMKGETNSTPKRTSRGTKRKKDPSASPETPVLRVQEKEPTPTVPAPSVPPPESRPTSSRGRRLTRASSAERPSGSRPSSPASTRRASKKPKTSHVPAEPSASTAAQPPAAPTVADAAAPSPPTAEELAVDGYTSHDSYSHDPIYPIDWRVYQVRTAKMTSNPSVTQYYHWVDGPDQEASFEHQVLKDVIPPNKVTWGVYKDPFDFHLRLSELVHVKWAKDSLKMVAVTREVPGVLWRGDVIVNFRRERTKRRFLAFLRRKAVSLLRSER